MDATDSTTTTPLAIPVFTGLPAPSGGKSARLTHALREVRRCNVGRDPLPCPLAPLRSLIVPTKKVLTINSWQSIMSYSTSKITQRNEWETVSTKRRHWAVNSPASHYDLHFVRLWTILSPFLIIKVKKGGRKFMYLNKNHTFMYFQNVRNTFGILKSEL